MQLTFPWLAAVYPGFENILIRCSNYGIVWLTIFITRLFFTNGEMLVFFLLFIFYLFIQIFKKLKCKTKQTVNQASIFLIFPKYKFCG